MTLMNIRSTTTTTTIRLMSILLSATKFRNAGASKKATIIDTRSSANAGHS